MNMRLACDNCGSQPCMCVEAECRRCNGEGEIEHPFLTGPTSSHAESPPDPVMVECEDCGGAGWIKCDGPRSTVPSCRFDYCYCEAAWDRQQEANASEPPPSARERQLQAQAERDALRSGRPL